MQQAAQNINRFFQLLCRMGCPSAWMDSVVLTNPDLVSFIQKHFVGLRIDMPKTQEGRKLAERYKIKILCPLPDFG